MDLYLFIANDDFTISKIEKKSGKPSNFLFEISEIFRLFNFQIITLRKNNNLYRKRSFLCLIRLSRNLIQSIIQKTRFPKRISLTPCVDDISSNSLSFQDFQPF